MFGIGAAMSAVNAAQRVSRNLQRATQRERRRRRRLAGRAGGPEVFHGPAPRATPRRRRPRPRSRTALWVLLGAAGLFGLWLLSVAVRTGAL